MDSDENPFQPQRPANFATTHWSLVLRAGDRGDADSGASLAALCERYWFPLYAYVRRRGHEPHEAQDLTQAFFLRVLEKNVLAAATPERGRFRSFLLTSMKNFLANDWDRQQAEKRGGGRRPLSFDAAAGESRLSIDPADDVTPEKIYQRQWALTLLDSVIARLQEEFAAAGKERQFELLKAVLTGDRAFSGYAAAAAELGMSEEAARQAAHRLRKRYRELLREEVAQTVADPGEVDQEIQSLFQALGA
jgi:RNA polymerase sigma factor (sigma-70 family)